MLVLVTGGAGFVGVNVLEALLERGHEVVSFDAIGLPPAAERTLERHRHRLRLESGSVVDAASVDALFRRYRFDRVVHAAAITSGSERESRDPGSIVAVNLHGTVNVLEAARRHDIARMVYVGSGAAYGESLYRLPRLYEQTPSIPTTLYGITKYAAERMCLRVAALWKLDLACVRLGTVIGPWERNTGARDNFGTHSQLAGMAVQGETAVLTAREIQRDWVYSRDVADAIVTLLHAPALKHTLYNVSSGMLWEEPILRWCQALARVFPNFRFRKADAGEEANIWYTDRDRGLMDVGRLAQDTGFTPGYSAGRAYEAYLEWIAHTPDYWTKPA